MSFELSASGTRKVNTISETGMRSVPINGWKVMC